MQVRVFGDLTLYEAKGEYQLVARRVETEGADGLWRLAFEKLRAKLEAEGLVRAVVQHEDHICVEPVRRTSPETRPWLVDSEKRHKSFGLEEPRRRFGRILQLTLRQGILGLAEFSLKVPQLALTPLVFLRVVTIGEGETRARRGLTCPLV